MHEIMSATQMKQADLQAIAEGQPAIVLIDEAALGLARIIADKYPKQPILFLNGPGNNGADGWIAAQYLKDWGWDVRCACTHAREELKNDAKEAVKRWNGDIEPLKPGMKLDGIVVDCIYGTGYSGNLPDNLVALFDEISHARPVIIAADVPSGLNATTGIAAPGTMKADVTVAFCRKKIAQVTAPGAEWCGEIALAPVSISQQVISAQGPKVFDNHPDLWIMPKPAQTRDDTAATNAFNGATARFEIIENPKLTLQDALDIAAKRSKVVIVNNIIASPDGAAAVQTTPPLENGASRALELQINYFTHSGLPVFEAVQAAAWHHALDMKIRNTPPKPPVEGSTPRRNGH